MSLPPFDYIKPVSLKEALKELTVPGTRILAGGTDLLGCLRDGAMEAQRLVSFNGLGELRGIHAARDGSVTIGALTTLRELTESELIRKKFHCLADAAGEVASPQLRNQGTIGGNLCQRPRCWYFRGDFHCLRKGGKLCYAVAGENAFHCIFGGDGCFIVHPSDTASALMALGASVTVVGRRGKEQVALDDFFVLPGRDPLTENILGPDELITEITIPAPDAETRSSYRKVRARKSWDFALAGVALAIRKDGDKVVDGRIVLSGAAPIPWRLHEVENELRGKPLERKLIERVAALSVQTAKPLSGNEYKVALVKGLLTEELEKLMSV